MEIELKGRIMSLQNMLSKLLELGVYEETLQVATDVAGYNEDIMLGILYSVFGVRDFEQLDEI